MARPETHLRRVPHYRTLDAAGFGWAPVAGAAAAERAFAVGFDAGGLALADLSALPRLGFKGRGTIPAMQKRGVVLEATANRAFRQPDGGLCLVLAASEVVLLGGLDGEGSRLDGFAGDWRLEDAERTYPMVRRDGNAWFAVIGAMAPDMFAKICGIDLRLDKFADLSIAQTSVARLNCILTRADLGVTPVFHLLADSASAAYFWSCLVDAADEFGAGAAGWSAVRDLQAT
jgi:sarcosine oxidase subunit gamma